jgi:hypothetical protein
VLRGIAIPVLAAAGIFMILAATSTGIGSALAPVAAGGFVVWDFGTATWGLLIPIIIWIGVGLYVLFSRDNRAAGGCVFAVLTAVLAFNSAILATDPQMWNFFVLQPFHDMWRLVGG